MERRLCSQCRGRWAGPGQRVAEVQHLICVNNWIAGEWQWQTGHAVSSAKWIAEVEHVFIMEVPVNGNSRQVTQFPQSDLRKRNALCVLLMELQANGNSRQVTWPPPQSELRKRNATCVFRTEAAANGNGRKQGWDGGRIGRAPLRLSFWRLCVKYSVRVLDRS